eukprot:gene10556-10365_t
MTPSLDNFYHLSRLTLVKDERFFDRFDQVFGSYFKGLEKNMDLFAQLPKDWLEKRFNREFTPEEMAAIEAMGGLDKLMERLKELLKEQKERHEGGSKWIGSGGTSPFGNNGFNPEGVRIGQDESRNRRAVKVWDQRLYQDYDDELEIGTRNIKIALRRLRRFAREGAQEELDLDNTIESTARNAGWLDLKMRPERHNSVKVLMLLDVGGSMDDHIRRTEELFSAAKSEFKHLEFYYFHNCVYDFLWKKNHRRHSERFQTTDILRTYNSDYRLIFVGDATMSPYEILQPGGSVEYKNKEAGAVCDQEIAQMEEEAPGGVVGGLLGNQIGGGSGKKVATAAGVVGGAVLGNKIEKDRNSTTQYDVVVQYDAGGSDVFSFSSPPSWQSGDRVKVVNGQITSSL